MKPAGRILQTANGLHDPLTIVRDVFLALDAIRRGAIEPEHVDWEAYRARCRGALTEGNVWGFER